MALGVSNDEDEDFWGANSIQLYTKLSLLTLCPSGSFTLYTSNGPLLLLMALEGRAVKTESAPNTN